MKPNYGFEHSKIFKKVYFKTEKHYEIIFCCLISLMKSNSLKSIFFVLLGWSFGRSCFYVCVFVCYLALIESGLGHSEIRIDIHFCAINIFNLSFRTTDIQV